MLCLLITSFNIARIEHENEVRRKALKLGKKWTPALFGIRNSLCECANVRITGENCIAIGQGKKTLLRRLKNIGMASEKLYRNALNTVKSIRIIKKLFKFINLTTLNNMQDYLQLT